MFFISVFLIAMVFSMFGMGGGLVYMPLFLLFIGSFREASVLSFLCILVTGFSSMIAYNREKLIDWKLVKHLGIPLIVAIFISGFILKTTEIVLLRIILGATLFLGGGLMIYPLYKRKIPNRQVQHFPNRKYRIEPVILSPVSLAIGLLSGIAGVSGVVYQIPLMTNVLGLPPHVAAASSSAILILASISGVLGRIFSNNLDVRIDLRLLLVLVCAFIGAQIGPQISLKLNKQVFRKVSGIFILIIGLFYILM